MEKFMNLKTGVDKFFVLAFASNFNKRELFRSRNPILGNGGGHTFAPRAVINTSSSMRMPRKSWHLSTQAPINAIADKAACFWIIKNCGRRDGFLGFDVDRHPFLRDFERESRRLSLSHIFRAVDRGTTVDERLRR
jgi:hypothetical protein